VHIGSLLTLAVFLYTAISLYAIRRNSDGSGDLIQLSTNPAGVTLSFSLSYLNVTIQGTGSLDALFFIRGQKKSNRHTYIVN
jgi:glucose uptake protein GlcU